MATTMVASVSAKGFRLQENIDLHTELIPGCMGGPHLSSWRQKRHFCTLLYPSLTVWRDSPNETKGIELLAKTELCATVDYMRSYYGIAHALTQHAGTYVPARRKQNRDQANVSQFWEGKFMAGVTAAP